MKKVFFIIIIFLTIYLLTPTIVKAEGENWLNGWMFRKKITINGSSNSGSNYRLLLKIGESSGANGADFHLEGHSQLFPNSSDSSGDIRITKSDGNTLENIWVEKVEGNSPNRVAYVWIKVSSNLDSNVVLYCYYGNSTAENISNYSNTILPYTDKLVTSDGGFQGRADHEVLIFNNKMWVLGGLQNISSPNYIYSSSDGINWSLETSNAPFGNRHGLAAVVFNEKMWVIGGYSSNGFVNDVWYSSDGINWTQATSNADWSPRSYHKCIVFNNKMYLMGGMLSNGSRVNDVWYSSDGINWTQATSNADWSPRHNFYAITYNAKMWVMGGSTNNGNVNDVWYSSDGVNWTRAVENAEWSPRQGFFLVNYDNGMMLGAGSNGGSDLWYSVNGSSWQAITQSANYPSRTGGEAVVFNNKLFLIGGYTYNYDDDVWVLNRTFNYPEPAFSSALSEESLNLPPNTPTNLSPANGTANISINPTLSASSFSDLENDSHTGTQWEVDDDSNFSSPVWTRTAETGEISTTINSTNGTFANELSGASALNYNTLYYFRVRYKDSGSNSYSSWSTATSFTTKQLSGNITTIKLSIPNNCKSGESIKILSQVLDSTGEAVNNAEVKISIWKPDNSSFLSNQTMNYLADSDGLYYYSLTCPSTEGTFLVSVKATVEGNNYYNSGVLYVAPWINSLLADIWTYNNRSLSTFGDLVSNIWSNSSRSLTESPISASDIWNYNSRSLTSFGDLVSDIWNNTTRTLTSSFISASDIWSYPTRSLTTFGNLVDNIWDNSNRTLTSSLTASEVWNYSSRSLTSFGNLVEEIWNSDKAKKTDVIKINEKKENNNNENNKVNNINNTKNNNKNKKSVLDLILEIILSKKNTRK
ncbi:MAG: hypothetical protein QXJ06_05550 [Candidatus Aenigmatarchaeota archaeon]